MCCVQREGEGHREGEQTENCGPDWKVGVGRCDCSWVRIQGTGEKGQEVPQGPGCE